ncbi:hypothetical protein HK104_001712 [Borealophlyctis nickersoniae]|nr:hypothetical protein HK104_001712 [Borealophlyctis nickersoniae]
MPSVLFTPIRNYDKERWRQQKAAEKAKRNQDDITFAEAFEVFKKYCLGQDLLITAHLETPKPEAHGKPLRGEVTLPRGLAKDDKSVVAVFAEGAQAEEARKLGAHFVGGDELIAEVAEGKLKVDKVLSTPAMFPKVIKIARVLGPKGLMPSPSRGTVSDDIALMMSALQAANKFEGDTDGFVHMEIGRTTWADSEVLANLKALVDAVDAVKPPKSNGNGGLQRLMTPVFQMLKYYLFACSSLLTAPQFVQNVNISAPHTAGMLLPKHPFRKAKPAKVELY